MTPEPSAIREFSDVSARQFQEEIYPSGKPAILRGFVSHWPCTKIAGEESTDALISYLGRFDSGRPVEILEALPGIGGHFFYSDDFSGTNFSRNHCAFKDGLRHIARANGQGVNMQSVPCDDILPGFSEENRIGFLSQSIRPRIWIGNQVTVQTHFDLSQNIACVIAGQREFTLFPPDQLPNLYMGPVERSLAGTPVSLVRIEDPDHERFPRFRQAQEAALTGRLGPGDAIFIPYFWWHHVRSLSSFNVLVNYWWNEYDVFGSPMDSFLHTLLTLRGLPAPMKAAWKAMFDEFVFSTGDEAVAHIPEALRGGLGNPPVSERAALWQVLARNVSIAAGKSRI